MSIGIAKNRITTEARNMVSELLEFCNIAHRNNYKVNNQLNFESPSSLKYYSPTKQNKPPIRFHIHIDADKISAPLENKLLDAGYQVSDFIKHNGGEARPRFIRTTKFTNVRKYNFMLNEAFNLCKQDIEFIGFVEGEVIVKNQNINFTKYANVAPMPFIASTEHEPGGYSKDSDMHVTLCPAQSDRRVLESLISMGFSCVLSQKSWGLAAVFSLQGSKK